MLIGAAVAVAATAAALLIDCPLASWCVADGCPGELARCFKVMEPFGHGLGVLVIAIALYQLDHCRRAALPRVLTMSLGAGLLADAVKLVVVRIRPKEFHFDGGVADSFGAWLPMFGVDSSGQSFPSAHTATAVGLAIALSWLYPRGRWLFGTLAVLVACQRIESGYHFPSDTIFGAAVGVFVAVACLKNERLGHWFDRLESRLAAGAATKAEPQTSGEPAESEPAGPTDCGRSRRREAA